MTERLLECKLWLLTKGGKLYQSYAVINLITIMPSRMCEKSSYLGRSSDVESLGLIQKGESLK